MNANTILNKAKSFVGVAESPANSNNVIFNTHYYGKQVSGAQYPWCTVFIWDVFRLCNASSLFYGGAKTASCETLYQYYKSKGQLVSTPKAGDIAFYQFDSDPQADHVGIVNTVSGTNFTAYEGNTSTSNDANGGEVMLRNRRFSQVKGFARPKYESVPVDTDKETTIKYRTHVSHLGDQPYVQNGASSGVTGEFIESIYIVVPKGYTMTAQAYISNIGWQDSYTLTGDGKKELIVGTTGQGNWIEAVRLYCNNEGINYRVYCKGKVNAWSDVVYQADGFDKKDNLKYAGTVGKASPIDKIQIQF